jgi:hypothetical protein
MNRTLGLLGLALVLVSTPASAQPFLLDDDLAVASRSFHSGDEPRVHVEATAAADCSGGLKYDDGIFENAYSFSSADARLVQRFDPVSSPNLLRQVCICWVRNTSDSSINFEIQVYDDNGSSGTPGTLLASIPASATGVPSNLPGAFYSYDISSAGINVSGNTFIGIKYNGLAEKGFYVCADEGTAPAHSAYASVNGGAFWGSLVSIFPLFEALGVRAELEDDSSASCTPGAKALCLNNGRFKVEATYTTSAQSGQADVVKLTDETGYLWFFSSTNVEAVVKVLNACGLNNRFWVFAGGLTNVQVNLTVTDTVTGNVKNYVNPQGTPFQPIQDTAALPCN